MDKSELWRLIFAYANAAEWLGQGGGSEAVDEYDAAYEALVAVLGEPGPENQ